MKAFTALLLSTALFGAAFARSAYGYYGTASSGEASGYGPYGASNEGSAAIETSGEVAAPPEVFFRPEECASLADGLYSLAACSTQFLTCSGGIARIMDCPAGLFYNSAIVACDWPEVVNCQQEQLDMQQLTTTLSPNIESSAYNGNASGEMTEEVVSTTSAYGQYRQEDQSLTDSSTTTTSSTTAMPSTTEATYDKYNREEPNVVVAEASAETPATTQATSTAAYGGAYKQEDQAIVTDATVPSTTEGKYGYGGASTSTVAPAADATFFTPEDCSTLSDGLYPLSACSTQFLTCSGGIARVMDCPAGLFYNAPIVACDWPENVNCQAAAEQPQANNKHYM